MHLFCGLIAGLLLLGCQASVETTVPIKSAVITPTSGVFTDAEEALYQERFAEMVKAFASGKLTTNYDTEVLFGQELSVSPLPRSEAQNLPEGFIAKLRIYAQEQNSDSFMIVQNGNVIEESFFKDINAQSLINAKSLAKPLGVIAVGRAIKLGFIDSLDQSASDYIVEWKGTDKEAVKIRHLLDMQSGLLPQGHATDSNDVLNRGYLHPRHIEVLIHEYPLVDAPGSRYEYSNANSELVSVIIERATSKAYPDWLEAEVFGPLGAGGGKIWMNRVGGMAHAGCCVGLPSETYLKLGLLILQNGIWNGETLLSPDFISQMVSSTPQNIYAGMGIYLGEHFKADRGASNPDGKTGFGGTLHTEPYVDKDLMLFDGNGNQVVYIMPSRNLVVMRLGPRPAAESGWDNAFLPNTVSRFLDAD